MTQDTELTQRTQRFNEFIKKSEQEKKIIIKAWQDTFGDVYKEKDIAEYEWEYAYHLLKRFKAELAEKDRRINRRKV